jgi:hypothetical protein
MPLVATAVTLSERRKPFLSAIPLSGASIGLLWLSHVYHNKALGIASRLSLMTLIGLACVSLFAYLGEKGAIDRERILVSVRLYFLIGIFGFVVYVWLNFVA